MQICSLRLPPTAKGRTLIWPKSGKPLMLRRHCWNGRWQEPIDKHGAAGRRDDGMREPTALVVVDVQNRFVNQHTAHVVAPIRALVDKCLAHRRPVVFTRFVNEVGSPFERLMVGRDSAPAPTWRW
jgi:hypothetical protein